MEIHELEFEVGTDGNVKARVIGAKGTACLEYAKLIEDLLGTKGDVEHTHEFYEPPTGVEIHVNNSN